MVCSSVLSNKQFLHVLLNSSEGFGRSCW